MLARAPWAPAVALALLWTVLLLVALAFRPLMPIDETRYVGVAWEMWTRGDWLVPHLNGAPYADKPPLLFWVIKAGWTVLGVGELWPRLVTPLFGLASLGAAWVLARRLWPGERGVAQLVPWILLGSLLWTVFATVTMFDLINALFSVLGATGLVMAWRGQGRAGWALFAAAIGLGVLTKGPVILVYLLPVALLAPWWARPRPNWLAWYGGLVLALAAGAAMALAWAMPAASAGGEAYRDAIFWGQTAGRLADSFAHARPFWWYLAALPVLLFPWALWPPLWRGLRRAFFAGGTGEAADAGVRFCLAWAVPGLLILSLISGKQPHYLLPLFPPFALVAAFALVREAAANGAEPRHGDQLFPGLVVAALGAGLTAVVLWMSASDGAIRALGLPPWAANVSAGFGPVVAAAGLAVILVRLRSYRAAVHVLAVQSAVVVTALHVFLFGAGAFAYDVTPVAKFLKAMENEQRPLVMADKYHGQFHFVGRLEKPIAVVPARAVRGWLAVDSRSRAIIVRDRLPPGWLLPWHEQVYRGQILTVWDVDTLPVYLNWLRDQAQAD